MIITNSVLVVLLRFPENTKYFANFQGSYIKKYCSFVICSSDNDYYDLFTISGGIIQFFSFFFSIKFLETIQMNFLRKF